MRETGGLFVSRYACLSGYVWKLEVDVNMFSPITFPSCVLRPGFSLNLEFTILVILLDHQIPETPPLGGPSLSAGVICVHPTHLAFM